MIATADAKHRFEILDLFRGIAAFAVLIFHSADWLGTQPLPNAYLAVDLFFMLSGFVIAHNYDSRITSGMSLKDFMLLRGIRLLPCYWLALAIGLVLATAHFIRDAGYLDGFGLAAAAFFNFFMLPAITPLYHGINMFPFNGASWTLTYELFANLAYWLTYRLLRPAAMAVLLAGSATGFVLAGRHVGTVDLGMREGEVFLAIARVVFSFFLGVALRRYVHDRLKIRLGPAGIFATVFILIATFCLPEMTRSRLAGEFVAIFAIYPLLLMSVSNALPGPRIASICNVVGNMSYPVYVLQTPVMLFFAAVPQVFFHKKGLEWAPLYGIAEVAIILLCSWWVDKYFELPARRRLKEYLMPRGRVAVGT